MAVLDWMIDHSGKMPYHTYLNVVLSPFMDVIDDYQWIISDFEFCHIIPPPLTYDLDYFILPGADFQTMINENAQLIWGAVVAVPRSVKIDLNNENYPIAEGGTHVFSEGCLQHSAAEIEILAIDSSYTIVKFSRQDLSDKFEAYFDEAIPLRKFTDNSIE